jgi:hypothetical protein
VDEGQLQTIQCTFDLYNRDLQRSVAIAANRNVVEQKFAAQPHTGMWRGGVVDSQGSKWLIPPEGLAGISAIYPFETESTIHRSHVTQINPSGIVSYIRRGTRYDGKGLGDIPSANYWAGSFTVIQPGKSNRVTVSYVPEQSLRQPQRRRERSRESATTMSWPDSFQLDLELVIGTFVEGEEPEKSKDLNLHNLTIDRVILPKSSAK